jgi:hypothetical protein
VAIANHRESFLDGELCRQPLREEEVGLDSPGLQRSGEGESSSGPVSAGRSGSDVGAGDLPWLENGVGGEGGASGAEISGAGNGRSGGGVSAAKSQEQPL